ncbi:MAG: hypothetical protein O6952_04080, partial [Planctomycetota bacterium]|nr:hypothetical protein [Planctomycetota bacterium]
MRSRLMALFLALFVQGCASLEVTSWEYRQPGQPIAVRAAASIGETVGFVAFMPVSLALLPILLPIVHIFDVGDPYTLLFLPSIKAGEVGSVAL